MKTTSLLCMLLLASGFAPFAVAQDSTAADASKVKPQTAAATIEVPRVSGEMKVDGMADEAFWQQAASFTLDYETRPGENTPAAVKTTVRIADSGSALRVLFEAEDPDPSKIRAFLRDRDSAYDDDFVGMNLDTFDSQQRAFEFYVNALGAQMDLIYEESNGNENDSWDGLWDSAGRIHDKGYTVEFEIPYATLRFPAGGATQQWAVDFVRFRPRENRFRYSNNRQDRNNNCYLCGLGKIRGFEGASPGRNLLVNPTLTASFAQGRSSPSADFSSVGPDFEAGVDVSWSPSPNHTLNATLNPDFSQVETDGAELDVNTTFALFFPEKRPFFLESADYFSTPFNLVYTRNVADPDIGLRSTGRVGDHTYGVFVARDAVTNFLRPGPFRSRIGSVDSASEDFVGSYRYKLDDNTTLGGLVTWRSADGYSNELSSFDGRWQKGAHTLTAQFMHTETEDAGGISPTPFEGDGAFASYRFNNRENSFSVSHQRFDPGFRADMGFVGQVDFRRSVIGGGHRWYPKDSFFNQINLNGDWDITHQLSTGIRIEREGEAYLSANGRMQSYFEIGGGQRNRYRNGVFFDETYYIFYGEFTPVPGIRPRLFYRGGDQIDFANTKLGRIHSWEPGVGFSFGRSLTGDLSATYETLSRDGGTVYRAKLADLRVSWQFNLQQRLRFTLQGSSIERDPTLFVNPVERYERGFGTQLVYSYKVNPRTVFFAGYSDGYFKDDAFDNFQTGRSLFLKWGYAWQP